MDNKSFLIMKISVKAEKEHRDFLLEFMDKYNLTNLKQATENQLKEFIDDLELEKYVLGSER